MEVGIAAAGTAVLFDNTVAFLSRNKRGALQAVRVGDGYLPQVFSGPEQTTKWERYSTISDAFAYNMQIDGHDFYILTFPTANATWAYDAVEKRWHQRSSDFVEGTPTRELANCHAYCGEWAGGTHILGDFNETGKLFAVSTSVYTFDGTNMERRVTGPTLSAENEDRVRFSQVQVDIEEGVSPSSEEGLILSYSKDGGGTYLGATAFELGSGSGGRIVRLMRRKLGRARLWNFRIYTASPRKVVIKGLWGKLYGEPKFGEASGAAA
jgi:hypothetical protein